MNRKYFFDSLKLDDNSFFNNKIKSKANVHSDIIEFYRQILLALDIEAILYE